MNIENKTYSEEETERLREEVKQLAFQHPDNFSTMLKHSSRKYLLEFIIQQTSPHLDDPFYTMATKCYWVINKIKDWNDERVCCRHCHTPLKHKNARVIRGYIRPHCNVSCSQSDVKVYTKSLQLRIDRYGSPCNTAKSNLTNAKKSYKRFNIGNQYEKLIMPFSQFFEIYKCDTTTFNKTKFEFQCKLCQRIFKDRFRYFKDSSGFKHFARCYHCFPTIKNESKGEQEIYELCKELCNKQGFTIKKHIRSLLHLNGRGLDVDVFIPELNLIIEYNGLYYHSLEFEQIDKRLNPNKNRNYVTRFQKTIEAEKNGYRLIHIEEYDWKSNKQKIIDLLQSIINQKYQFKLENNIEIIDRSIFNKINICKGYKIIKEIPGKLIQVDKFHFYTCGYLVYKRLNIK